VALKHFASVMAAASAAVCLLLATAAQADGSQPDFVSTSPVLTFAKNEAATHVQVLNPGSPAKVCFEIFLLPRKTRSYSSPTPIALAAGDITAVAISYAQRFAPDFTTATLVMTPARTTKTGRTTCPQQAATQPATSFQPETIELALSRATGGSALWVPLVVGLVLALLVIGGCRLWQPEPANVTAIKAGSAWSFGDSFATNVSAVGGVFASVLTAFGSSSTLLPGVQTDRFALLSALWASLAVLAPVVVGMLTTSKKIDIDATEIPLPGLMLALGVIVLAAEAQLTTLIVLLSKSTLSSLDQWCAGSFLSLLGLCVAWYVIQTTRTLLKTQATAPRSSLNTSARAALLP
jgi:hypothetical protein